MKDIRILHPFIIPNEGHPKTYLQKLGTKCLPLGWNSSNWTKKMFPWAGHTTMEHFKSLENVRIEAIIKHSKSTGCITYYAEYQVMGKSSTC